MVELLLQTPVTAANAGAYAPVHQHPLRFVYTWPDNFAKRISPPQGGGRVYCSHTESTECRVYTSITTYVVFQTLIFSDGPLYIFFYQTLYGNPHTIDKPCIELYIKSHNWFGSKLSYCRLDKQTLTIDSRYQAGSYIYRYITDNILYDNMMPSYCTTYQPSVSWRKKTYRDNNDGKWIIYRNCRIDLPYQS